MAAMLYFLRDLGGQSNMNMKPTLTYGLPKFDSPSLISEGKNKESGNDSSIDKWLLVTVTGLSIASRNKTLQNECKSHHTMQHTTTK